jgi:hypothetical protein
MPENDQKQSKLKALWLKLIADKQRIVGAMAAILVPNIAKYLLSFELVSRWFFNLFGVSPSTYFYNNLRYFVIAILLVGYMVVFYFIYRKFIAPMDLRRRAVLGVATVLVIGGLFTLNVYALPRPPNPRVLIPTKDWSKLIADSQITNSQLPDDGGIRTKAGDQSFPPQVWTTAQAVTALLADQKDLDDKKISVIKKAFDYIEKARSPAPSTSGDPDEGWGLYEGHKKGITEIAGWVTVAYISSLESKTKIWDDAQRPIIRDRVRRDLALIVSRQSADGGWRPITDDKPKFTRTYSTAIALWSLIEARHSAFVREVIKNDYDKQIREGINWLLRTYQKMPNGVDHLGWVPNPNRSGQREAFDGLTAQVLFILSRIEDQEGFKDLKKELFLLDYKKTFIAKQDLAKRFVCANDRIHDFDLSFTSDQGPAVDFVLEGSTLLWFPWSYAALTALSKDDALSPQEQAQAKELRKQILAVKVDDINKFVNEEFIYVMAENLYCFSVSDQ